MTGIYINGFHPSVDLLRVVNQFKRILDYKTPDWYFACYITKEKTWVLRRDIYRVKMLMINNHENIVIESKSPNPLQAVFYTQRQVWQRYQEYRDKDLKRSELSPKAKIGNSLFGGQH